VKPIESGSYNLLKDHFHTDVKVIKTFKYCKNLKVSLRGKENGIIKEGKNQNNIRGNNLEYRKNFIHNMEKYFSNIEKANQFVPNNQHFEDGVEFLQSKSIYS